METLTKPIIFFGIDIGGTLAKICIWHPKEVKEIPIGLPNIENLKIPFKKGQLIFTKFAVSDISSVFKAIKELHEKFEIKLNITGGGAYKYVDLIKEVTPESSKDGEIGSLVKGMNFLMQNVENYSFYYRDNTGYVYIKKKPEYPFLLINIGSGVSAIKFVSKDEYARIGGTTLGGGTFLGLSNLLLGTSDFDELLELARKGKCENANLLIKDIYYGQDSPHSKLSSEGIAVSLGKMAMDHLRNIKKVKKEDMALSLLMMVAFNISQLSYYLAKNENIKHVYFGGNFIRHYTATMECVSSALSYFSHHDGEEINAIFLQHDGFLGALGCAVDSAETMGFKIIDEQ